jgi:hypothetical protein
MPRPAAMFRSIEAFLGPVEAISFNLGRLSSNDPVDNKVMIEYLIAANPYAEGGMELKILQQSDANPPFGEFRDLPRYLIRIRPRSPSGTRVFTESWC